MNQAPVSIVIVNYKSASHLERLLSSLNDQRELIREIVLVNHSPEEELAGFVRQFEQLPLCLETPAANLGFAGGNNLGIARSRGEYVLLLNPDTEVEKDALPSLMQAFDTHPEAHVVLPKLLMLNNKAMIDRVWDGYTRYGQAVTIGYRELDQGQYDESCFVFGARGAACIFRRSFLDSVGLFDEDLFAYYEDVDLSIRGQLMGKRFLYWPQATIYHLGSGSTGSTYNATTVYFSMRNKFWVFIKTMPTRLLWKNGWRFGLWMLLMGGYYTYRLRNPLVYFRALLDALRGAAKFVAKRRGVKQLITTAEFERLLKECERQNRDSRKFRHEQTQVAEK